MALGKGDRDWQPLTELYRKRMPRSCVINVVEVTPVKTHGDNLVVRRELETVKLLAAVPKGHFTIILDERGKELSTPELAQKLSTFYNDNQDISCIIGGAEGLDKGYFSSAQELWSLSRLTLPHQMVRLLLVEQLYRAWSIMCGHPYHRDQ